MRERERECVCVCLCVGGVRRGFEGSPPPSPLFVCVGGV